MLEVAYIEKDELKSIGLGAFEYFESPPSFERITDQTTLIVLNLGDSFVAYANIWSCPTNDNINYLEVSPPNRGKVIEGRKISHTLLEECFRFCADNSKHLVHTRFSPKRSRSLAPVEPEIASRYPDVTVGHMQI